MINWTLVAVASLSVDLCSNLVNLSATSYLLPMNLTKRMNDSTECIEVENRLFLTGAFNKLFIGCFLFEWTSTD